MNCKKCSSKITAILPLIIDGEVKLTYNCKCGAHMVHYISFDEFVEEHPEEDEEDDYEGRR